ncbi:hypothetical protein Kpol_1033p6 [Vanderwaltozyma polyspora DSM 70294]|uniref:DUF155 domain-containing protein n=1 Tax=Vanderwaltozyma polyspora (strain ATCC 22028 / DSM 70294 / BCRC 21397 / CBS 2163 / NBRC 10782 / NRRL Y-8283 / UCD 57-17) TaxID=436907 RepID=A7TJ04_VANPO|nr:uncharacterized protein Kpol_1033p6 [Vanderwaltozyma polyspora DSM 70294]EDO17703.1 hypothetical protein Kpol_1033p6 [Vanderwaltozyma polyspora DSM 70294]
MLTTTNLKPCFRWYRCLSQTSLINQCNFRISAKRCYSEQKTIEDDIPYIRMKMVRSPRSIQQNPSRYLRRSFVPKYSKAQHLKKDWNVQNLSTNYKVKVCTTITTGERYDLSKAIGLLNLNGLQPSNLIPNEIVTFKYIYDGVRGDIMVLGQNGSVVSWGFDENTLTNNILPLIESAIINPLVPDKYESEDLDFIELDNEDETTLKLLPSGDANEASFIAEDVIVINSIDQTSGLLDKAAFSSGISRSTSLAVLESALEEHINRSRIITESVSNGKKMNLNERDFLKSIGRLFLIRGKLNLYSEIIETPDLYWSEPQLEKIYKNVSKYLDVVPRINILNSKLDYSTDESRALLAVLNERKSTFLEWIIIYLIAFEVCFELYHYYEKNYIQTEQSSTDKENKIK